ncbi:hypothetical protein [uncultured Winogradskyella sp.]|uniref:hypothetical protein n=1 Tax=uncultured Winogradskyella sp. TaxID=395353 RepID=UPI002608ADDD|nr:hypothetical protein [uncultured Winogradskyella sp.]
MKTLKITLALVAVLVLTVSGVQSNETQVTDKPTYETKSNFDLLAVNKKKKDIKQQG